MKIKAVIDRIEEDQAVLLVGLEEEVVNWPCSALPSAATEGDYLQIQISVDEEQTAAAKKEAADLLQQLLDKKRSL